VPRISRALLSKRLRELAEHGIITSTGGEYLLTDAGRDLGEVVVHLGQWGARYHPLREGLQKALSARVALGLEI
jgi:DNA-binding HxlR family transcriptional regulator